MGGHACTVLISHAAPSTLHVSVVVATITGLYFAKSHVIAASYRIRSFRLDDKEERLPGEESETGTGVLRKLMTKEENGCAIADSETGLGALPYAGYREILHYGTRVHSGGRNWQTKQLRRDRPGCSR